MTLRFGLWTTALVLAATSALAQPYPARPVRLIVPTTPGGSVDTLARTIGPRLSERWGQQVVVDNREMAEGDPRRWHTTWLAQMKRDVIWRDR